MSAPLPNHGLPADDTSRDGPGPLLAEDPWWQRESILVAASGGIDSTVLLDLLCRHVQEGASSRSGVEPIRLGAACLDHGWRGREGARDLEHVARLCAARGVPFFGGRVDAPRLARTRRLSPEAAGREARYRFLADVARREGFAAVATAHHAGDRLETLLIRMERGGREEGRAGIRRWTRIAGVDVVRPLLEVEPTALVAYAEARRLPFREDATNRDSRFPRNRLRGLAAGRVDRGDAEALLRLAGLRARLLECMGIRLEELWSEATPAGVRLPCDLLLAVPGPLRRELLRLAFHRASPSRRALPERALDRLEELLPRRTGGDLDLPGIRARVSLGSMLLEPAAARPKGTDSSEVRRKVVQRGTAGSAGAAFGGFRAGEQVVERFDVNDVRGELRLRLWKPGDRIAIRLGLPAANGQGASGPEPSLGSKKVKEVLREARVPRWAREAQPVLADEAGVLWVIGVRRGARALPRPGRAVYKVTVERVLSERTSSERRSSERPSTERALSERTLSGRSPSGADGPPELGCRVERIGAFADPASGGIIDAAGPPAASGSEAVVA